MTSRSRSRRLRESPGSSAIQSERERSVEPGSAAVNAGVRPSQASKTARVDKPSPGLARTNSSRGNPGIGLTRSPIPSTRAGLEARKKGTSAPSESATEASRRELRACGSSASSARSTAPASLDPPPSPAATGIGPVREIVLTHGKVLDPDRVRRRLALEVDPTILARCNLDENFVGEIHGHKKALDPMVSIRATPQHPQPEVDLGVGDFPPARAR